MEIISVKSVYFSATNTTKKIAQTFTSHFGSEVTEYELITAPIKEIIHMLPTELLVVSMPVYAGRIPKVAAESLRLFRGTDTPVIVIAVYGNREYDDALVEMKDIVETNGFKVIAGAAFIARHSVFPSVSTTRPDAKDKATIAEYAQKCQAKINDISNIQLLKEVKLPGNRPYKEVGGGMPIYPTADANCTKCGKCYSLCPVKAIPENDFTTVNPEKCIRCGHCIQICPTRARNYYGEIYQTASAKFHSAYSKPEKEPEIYI